MDRPRLVAVVPAFNEAATIGQVVTNACHHCTVLVVDDCSRDGTSAKAEAAGAIVVRNPRNLGYEGALNRGFDVAMHRGFTHIVTVDADGEHDPAVLAAFARELIDRRTPLVLGVRPHRQRLAEVIMGLYVRCRFGAHDILCGMKGYDAELVRRNGGFDTSNAVGTELALNSIRRGIPFEEIRVSGTRRVDAPRFDRRWKANLRILRVLGRLLRDDVRHLLSKRQKAMRHLP